MKHARLSPSSSSRWLNCTASVKVSEQYENTGNSAATWGTQVHYIGEQLLKGEIINVGDTLQERGNPEFIVDEEMLDTAAVYADYVRSFIKDDSEVLIEEQFNLSSVAPEQFGTSDATVLNGTHLHIFDLKTGLNLVNAKENTQLMLYAIGAVDELEAIYDIETVTLHIVQTRINHIESWDTTYGELMKFKSFAKQQAEKILSDNVEFTPTKKACMWCLHKANCEALRVHVEKIVASDFDDIEEIDGKANLISNEAIKKILDNAELITDFIKAVKDVALERMEQGEQIDGYKVVESRKNRKWVDEDKVKEYIATKDNPEQFYKPAPLKPMTQVLKMLKDDDKLDEFIIRPKGVPVIAPVSDKRPPIEAGEMFDNC